MESPKRGCDFGVLRGKMLAFKNALRLFLAIWRLPLGQGLAFKSFAFKKRFSYIKTLVESLAVLRMPPTPQKNRIPKAPFNQNTLQPRQIFASFASDQCLGGSQGEFALLSRACWEKKKRCLGTPDLKNSSVVQQFLS